ncbi:hypothetical protein TAO_0921 [Candidatus Nitrosoglobus terrae]|uniref:TRUD domain-containing protein n=1 Tax=Candidatus Nitrosoglobus terrae TaxID=1630141 RepID=A0A1Q2SME2_9GAMM|nr:tRNA pseudouridine(13) synthase TruD [Candidatus Nitrosoglobus terrae]BAW80291.1 hypothetical protein TAO_0921 [Candidatus Nitrosoglobus terrae]
MVKRIRHHRKLQRGVLKGNWFLLTLRQFCGSHERVSAGLERIKAEGVPNYFGSQRFGRENQNLMQVGRENQNLMQAYQWFTNSKPPKDRHLRGLPLSA